MVCNLPSHPSLLIEARKLKTHSSFFLILNIVTKILLSLSDIRQLIFTILSVTNLFDCDWHKHMFEVLKLFLIPWLYGFTWSFLCFFFLFVCLPPLLSWQYDKGLEFLSLEMLCLERGQMLKGRKKKSQHMPCLPEIVTVYTEVLINKKIASCTSTRGSFISL